MAEGGARPRDIKPAKTNLVCRYFLHGACTKGSSCKYIHDRSGSQPMDNICRYYQLGRCTYGERCRYDHVRKENRRHSASHNHMSPGSRNHMQPLTVSNSQYSASHNHMSSGCQNHVQPITVSDLQPSRMVTLSKKGIDHSIRESEKRKQSEAKWAQAKAFVPGQRYYASTPASYAAATGGSEAAADPHHPAYTPQGAQGYSDENFCEGATANSHSVMRSGLGGLPLSAVTRDTPLCPYYAVGHCPREDECKYVHGDICDMCGMPQLHPLNKEQREAHEKECLLEHEKEMEKAFAIQASADQECGICLENVLNKESTPDSVVDRRFGILENCNHCFCLPCIRQWRGNKEIAIETHRSCPTCRTHSDFITPSKYWVTDPEEKAKLIQDYKKALKAKPCHYFKKGKGACPFNRKCFYLHALEDGTIVESNQVRCRRRVNADRELTAADTDYNLWDYISTRDSGAFRIELGFDRFYFSDYYLSSSDDDVSDYSDVYHWESDSSED